MHIYNKWLDINKWGKEEEMNLLYRKSPNNMHKYSTPGGEA